MEGVQTYRELCACGGEVTPADIEARACTSCGRKVVCPTKFELQLADLMIAMLRDDNVSPAEAYELYASEKHADTFTDRALEAYHAQHGRRVKATRVRAAMRRKLSH